MSDEDRTDDDESRRLPDKAEPVPEADALEQMQELDPEEDDEPSDRPDAPDADALEQSRAVPSDEDERR